MYKKLFALAFISLFSANIFLGQNKTEVDTRFGYGLYPLTYDLFGDSFFGDDWDCWEPSVSRQYLNALEFAGNRYSSGCFSFSRHYKVRRWLELGASLSYAGTYQNIYNTVDMSIARRDDYHSLFFTPSVRFAWLNREWVRMYSSVGFGLGVMINSDDPDKNEVGPSIQLTGFGISVGKRFFGFSEIQSIGTLGFVTFGFGYRFTTNKPCKKQ